MNYNKKTVQDVDVKGKKVLLRCDFNVPQDKETGAITSDKRIVAALPTIKYLLDNGAAVIACSHLGKPKGEWKMKLTLAPVAERLSQLLGQEVIFAKDIVGEDAKVKAAALQPGQIMLLENLRFDIREEKNDPGFAKELADMAELYVSDAFGISDIAQPSSFRNQFRTICKVVALFLLGISADMVDNVLVDDFSFQVNHTTKKTPVSFFEMAVLFFYSASVCRLLIITIFLPSPQYLFSVFYRRKSGHLPELP